MQVIKYIFSLVVILNIWVCSTSAQTIKDDLSTYLNEYDVCLYDNSRKREIPVAVYASSSSKEKKSVVIMNHGYDGNKGGSYHVYSYLTRALAENNYFVISIQHELPDDDLLAMEGNFLETRMPNWKRGTENMVFVIKEFKKIYPELNWEDVTLVGHSNGGDASMVFGTIYLDCGYKIISLDHRRMPIPRNKNIKVFSLRGCDYPADEGVLPDKEELKEYPITIVSLPGIKHGDMDDKGSEEQKRQIIDCTLGFLKE